MGSIWIGDEPEHPARAMAETEVNAKLQQAGGHSGAVKRLAHLEQSIHHGAIGAGSERQREAKCRGLQVSG